MKMNFNFVKPESDASAARAARAEGRRQCGDPRPAKALHDLAAGESAVVASIDASGPVGRRLLDLGLLPGTPVRMLRRAPLGDPTVYELRGYRLCLRRQEGERVRVTAPELSARSPETSQTP